MDSYYLILRIHPAVDFQGKSDAEILKKIEANYKALTVRDLKVYPPGAERDKALKLLDEAKAVLSDPKKREEHDKQLEELAKQGEPVTIEIMELTDELLEEFEQEIQQDGEKTKD